jgi:hypothetical protein
VPAALAGLATHLTEPAPRQVGAQVLDAAKAHRLRGVQRRVARQTARASYGLRFERASSPTLAIAHVAAGYHCHALTRYASEFDAAEHHACGDQFLPDEGRAGRDRPDGPWANGGYGREKKTAYVVWPGDAVARESHDRYSAEGRPRLPLLLSSQRTRSWGTDHRERWIRRREPWGLGGSRTHLQVMVPRAARFLNRARLLVRSVIRAF